MKIKDVVEKEKEIIEKQVELVKNSFPEILPAKERLKQAEDMKLKKRNEAIVDLIRRFNTFYNNAKNEAIVHTSDVQDDDFNLLYTVASEIFTPKQYTVSTVIENYTVSVQSGIADYHDETRTRYHIVIKPTV